MKVTVKAYYFMDKLFLTQKEVQENAEGWEHYESIETVYISIDEDELNEIKSLRSTVDKIEYLESADKSIFETFEDAELDTRLENGGVENMNKEFKTILSELQEVMDKLDNFNYKKFGFDSDNKDCKQIEKSYVTLREELEKLQELEL